jgi:hypothetical protein
MKMLSGFLEFWIMSGMATTARLYEQHFADKWMATTARLYEQHSLILMDGDYGQTVTTAFVDMEMATTARPSV